MNEPVLHQGVYLPHGEQHMVEWMTRSGEMVDGKGTYQIRKLRKALSFCTSLRTAVDVGAHVGLWSMQLANRFTSVHAFEPVPEHQDCFLQNMADAPNEVVLHPFALGEHEGRVSMITPEANSSGSTMIAPNGGGDIEMRTLDSFELIGVDFMKLDCEGYELHALRGGEATIKRDMPVIIVEQKKGRAQRFGLPETGAVDYLKGLGYSLASVMSGDYILVPL